MQKTLSNIYLFIKTLYIERKNQTSNILFTKKNGRKEIFTESNVDSGKRNIENHEDTTGVFHDKESLSTNTAIESGNLRAHWSGKWYATDAKIYLYINEKEFGPYSLIKGFDVENLPMTRTTTIKVKMAIRSHQGTFQLDTKKNYTILISQSRASGGIKFTVQDDNGQIIKEE